MFGVVPELVEVKGSGLETGTGSGVGMETGTEVLCILVLSEEDCQGNLQTKRRTDSKESGKSIKTT